MLSREYLCQIYITGFYFPRIYYTGRTGFFFPTILPPGELDGGGSIHQLCTSVFFMASDGGGLKNCNQALLCGFNIQMFIVISSPAPSEALRV